MSDENALDDLDRGSIRRRPQKELAIALEPDIPDEVETAFYEWRHGQNGARSSTKLLWCDARADELRDHFEPGRQKRQKTGGVSVLARKGELDSNSGGGVAGDDLSWRVRTQAETQEQVIELGEFVGGPWPCLGGTERSTQNERKSDKNPPTSE